MKKKSPKRQRQFSQEERAAFAQVKDEIRDRLRGIRANSQAIVEVAQRMYQVKQQKWHLIDNFEKAQPWAYATFGIGIRHASDFFTIGQHLQPALVADTGLGIKRLHQVALTPEKLRPDLIAVAVREALSSRDMKARRLAALPLWQAGDEAGARARLKEKPPAPTTQQAAPKPEPEPEPPPAPPVETPDKLLADAAQYLEMASAALHRATGLAGRRLTQEAWDAAQGVEELRGILAMGRALAPPRAEKAPAEKNPELEFRARPRLRTRPPRPGRPPSMLAPLSAALRIFLPEERETVGGHLYGIMRGDDPEEHVSALRILMPMLGMYGAPRHLLDLCLARLSDPVWERRALFAMQIHLQARLPGLHEVLMGLRERAESLPPRLRQVLERFAPPDPPYAGPAP
jgi:hypothetical protein